MHQAAPVGMTDWISSVHAQVFCEAKTRRAVKQFVSDELFRLAIHLSKSLTTSRVDMKLTGLVTQPDLNGRLVMIVKGENKETGRVGVELGNGKRVSVKRDHLQPLHAGEKGAPAREIDMFSALPRQVERSGQPIQLALAIVRVWLSSEALAVGGASSRVQHAEECAGGSIGIRDIGGIGGVRDGTLPMRSAALPSWRPRDSVGLLSRIAESG